MSHLARRSCALAWAALAAASACDGGETTTDCTCDTDSDSDGDECTSEGVIDWASSDPAVLNEVIGNWSILGAFDANMDGVIDGEETSETTFTMEDLFCYGQEEGAQSVVVLMSDTS